MINYWTKLSIEYANQRSYLDDLYRVYPIIPNGLREVDEQVLSKAEAYFNSRKNVELLKTLLQLKLFPIKDSYIPYLRKDKSALFRNPQTVNRICGRLYELGFNKIYENCTEPKETNRQIGPMFRRWLNTGALGLIPIKEQEFLKSSDNAVLDGSDKSLQDFAARFLDYTRDKGLDFIGRFNGKYVIGEAKFISDEGGHQNAQFNDVLDTLSARTRSDVVKVGIIDGVPYIESKKKMHRELYSGKNIMSALVLREFLYQV